MDSRRRRHIKLCRASGPPQMGLMTRHEEGLSHFCASAAKVARRHLRAVWVLCVSSCVASGPAWSEALARVALKGLPVALHPHEMVDLAILILQLNSMQCMKGFCNSRAEPDQLLQIIGMQFIRYRSRTIFANNRYAIYQVQIPTHFCK